MDDGAFMTGGLEQVALLATEVAQAGRSIALPYVAATHDISNPRPMVGPGGRPLAESHFRWIDPDLRYWEDRGFALRAAFIHATRTCAEPFFYRGGRLQTWRPNATLAAITAEGIDSFGVGAAVICPTYLPGGLIGAVVWASAEEVDVEAIFASEAARLHALALKFMGVYVETFAQQPASAVRLTRREIQCLKWAAAGKTDAEIAAIVGISLPTVRFHINNAARKLRVVGRSQAIHRAGILGYVAGAPIRSDS